MRILDAANYIKTSKASKTFLALIFSIKKVFNFNQERLNRIARYIQITRAYKAGNSISDIANKYKCDKSTILRYARLAEIPKRPKHFPEEIKASVIVDLKRNILIKIIASNHDVSEAYVSKIAKEAGLSRYKNVRRKANPKTLRQD